MKYIRTFEQQSTDHLKDVIDWKLLRYLQEYLTPLTDKGVSVLIEIEVNNITTYI